MPIKKAPHKEGIETPATRLYVETVAKAWKKLRKTEAWETYLQAREEAKKVSREATK